MKLRVSLPTTLLFLALFPQVAFGCTQKVEYEKVVYEVCIADYKHSQVRTMWKNSDGRPYETLIHVWGSLQALPLTPVFAINAGIYMDNLTPLGLYIEGGRQLRPLNTKKGLFGNFYVQPNGVLAIWPDGRATVNTTAWFAAHLKDRRPTFATQSGPMLVIGGKINANFKEGSAHRLIRNGVGVTKNAIVLVKSEGPTSFYDFAKLFRDKLGAQNALYLDGNISDSMSSEHGPLWPGQAFGAMIVVTGKR